VLSKASFVIQISFEGNMLKPFATIPESASLHPVPFQVQVPQAELDHLKALFALSKIAPATIEGLQEDREYGVSIKWLAETKAYWESNFDWQVIKRQTHC
jgi:hypothetical protein